MAVTQKSRRIALHGPLGPDKLLFRRMVANEALSRLFEYRIDLLSEDREIALEKVLAKELAVEIEDGKDNPRFFHGYATSFSYQGQWRGLAAYRAIVRPWAWFLSRTADSRIFQEMTVPEIVKEVFRDRGFSNFEDSLSGSYRTWNYCVQYRETDLNFVCRLMEHEGIYFFFKHEKTKHVLVMADALSAHSKPAGYGDIPYYPLDPKARRDSEHVWSWASEQVVQPGEYVINDYDFEKPQTDLLVKNSVSRKHDHADLPVFDYPGTYTQTGDGDHYVKARLEELAAQHAVVHADGNVRSLFAGSLLELSDYPREDQNGEYLLTSAVHELEQEDYAPSGKGVGPSRVYVNRFVGIPSKQQYRPPRVTPKPFVQGPQTATVVGPSGEEIWTDKYGRVKVQFHWDRVGKDDEHSSCWIRVAQVWAGKSWGAMHIPRIGQEVIVDFLEGDPDQPIVTGRIYNAEQMPPYALPDNMTQSGIKSRSTKDGSGDNFNELRFEDKKGDEEIYFHAEKNFTRIVENNDVLEVGFHKKDKGNQTVDIYNDRTTTLDQGHEKLQVKKGNRDVLIDTGNDTHTIKTGNRTVEIDSGNDSLTIKTGNRTVKLNAGKESHEAAVAIELKVGASSIKIEPAKITLKSVQIEIVGDATAKLQGTKTDIIGSALVTVQGGVVKIN